MKDTCNHMHQCLYFTSQALCRTLNRMAEEALAPTGLAPSQTYLLMLIRDRPGITQKELGLEMQLAPSTVTRFIDDFVRRGLVSKETAGKLACVTATEQGLAMEKPIQEAWQRLYDRFTEALGPEQAHQLALQLDAAVQQLEP